MPLPKKSPDTPSYSTNANKSAIGSQFQNVPIPLHRHNGSDSPRINYNDITDTPTIPTSVVFGGTVGASGTGTLPAGWTVAYNSPNYTITHNLGYSNYAVVATSYGNVGASAAFVTGLNTSTTYFNIEWQNSSSAIVQTNFTFFLTKIA